MTFAIAAAARAAGNADVVRNEGKLPGVVYGPEIEPISIAVDYRDFETLYQSAGESSLIDCTVEGQKEPITVLVQDIQFDPVKGRMIHVDFRQIKMGEEMGATIELRFVGDSLAVKQLGGTLISSHDTVNVRCLPKDLVGHIDVDLSPLATFDDAIKMKDLPLPSGMTLVDNPETAVAKVLAPLTEDQLKKMEETEAVDVAGVEVEGEKKEGDEAEAGDAKEEKKEEGEKKEA